MTEPTLGSNQRNQVASGQVPFVPSAINSESTTASLVPAAQQPNSKASTLVANSKGLYSTGDPKKVVGKQSSTD